MIRLKPCVRLDPTIAPRPEVAFLLVVAASVFDHFGYDMWVTAATDGPHKPGSFHYQMLALDLRSHHLPGAIKPAVLRELRASLPQCDVLLEGEGTPSEHFHLEWDPKDV
jgi:hypothetical protein